MVCASNRPREITAGMTVIVMRGFLAVVFLCARVGPFAIPKILSDFVVWIDLC